MAMVYGFVKRNKGKIHIHSEPGKGTLVTIYFPRALTDISPLDKVEVEQEIKTGHEQILVVDDDDDLRELTLRYLKDLGYQTLQASNAKMALDIIRNNPDIKMLLSDVILPGMNGFQLADEVISFDFRLDFAYPVNWFPVRKTYLYAGPRLSFYTATFEFVGGDEFFDIQSTQFGLGTGLETHLGISQNLSFVFSGAFDYFFDSEIGGHDTFYNPDGTDISGRLDYTYDDADEAIDQPNYVVRLIGWFKFRFVINICRTDY